MWKIKVRERDRQNRKRIKAAIFLCVVLLGLVFFYYRFYKVVPTFSQVTYEYGERVSQEITDYLSGTDWSVGLGELDLSQVDEGSTGVYEAVVRHGRSEYTYSVVIEDTIPPQILRKEGKIYLAAGREHGVEEVIAGINDADPEAEAFFAEGEDILSEIGFDRTGEYEVEVLARDRAGNESRARFAVTVDTPPVFAGIHNFYCVPGSAPDFRESVTARDDVDGNLTKDIRIDDSGVSLDQAGEYTLRYTAEDSFGLETTEEARVLIAAPEEIQELIGRRQIDYRQDTIIGAPNIYDSGASGHEDLEETLEYLRPAFVQLYHATGRGGYSAGSGYIMEITEDSIYICSNSHVVEKFQDWDIYFYDGTVVPGRAVGTSDIYDVGVAVVDLADVDEELLAQLMTVHIDGQYWESLDRQDIGLALERIDRKGGLLHRTTGKLIKIKQAFVWNDQRDHTEVTVELVHGDSGSAVVDGYGNLICMAYAYSTEPLRYWCIPLDGILDCYQEITGRLPYVY